MCNLLLVKTTSVVCVSGVCVYGERQKGTEEAVGGSFAGGFKCREMHLHFFCL